MDSNRRTAYAAGSMNKRISAWLWAIPFAVILQGCAADGPQGTVWKLDNLKSIGGHVPEVLGSPQIVQTPHGSGMQFNGQSDGLILPTNPLKGLSQFTIEMLFKPDAGGLAEQRFLHAQDEAGSRALMETRLFGDNWAFDAFLLSGSNQLALYDRTKLHPVDRWTWVAMVYDNGKFTSYIDGVKELEGNVAIPPMGEGKISLGVRQNKVYWFKGTIQQVRFHQSALTPDQLQRPSAK